MSTLALDNCNVVDVENASVIENVRVVVHGRIIKEVSSVTGHGQEKAIDMNGSFVLPGLINVHSHLSMTRPSTPISEPPEITVLRAYRKAHDALTSGVTTLRTQGELHRVDVTLRKMINENWIQGPRIMAGGKGLGVSGGHGSHFGRIGADSPDEFLKAARTELFLGADHLKIFITGGIPARPLEKLGEAEMTQEEMEAVVRVGRYKGTYVTAHAASSQPILQAVRAGVTCFEHGYMLNHEAAKAIKEVNGYLVPTLIVTRSPVWMRANGFSEQSIKIFLSVADTHLQSIKVAVSEGVRLITGTDLFPGDLNDGVNTTVNEMEFLTQAGLSPIEAIRSSTIYAAELCRISDKVGLVKPGYAADLIAVPKNPMRDLKSIRQIGLVMKDGQVIRDDLHRK